MQHDSTGSSSGPGRIVAAISDAGPLWARYAELFSVERRTSGIAAFRLAGVVGQDARDAAVRLGAPFYPDIPALLEAEPATSVVFNADGLDPAGAPGVALIDENAGRLLLSLLGEDDLCGSRQFGLFRMRGMLTAVLDQMKEDIVLLDRQGRIRDCNKGVWERRGLRKEDLLGRTAREVLDDPEGFCAQQGAVCPFDETIRAEKEAEAVYTRVDSEGRMHYYRVRTYPVYEAPGQLAFVAEVRRDITQHAYMEMRLQQAERMAAIGELSTFIAHEIRNPLFAISGFANSLLRTQGLDGSAREKLGIILQESRRLDEILKSIMNFTRPTEAKSDSVDVNRVAADTLGLMRLGLEGQGVEVRAELGRDLPLAKADPELFKQCLINLLRNAGEAMPRGGEVRVATRMAGGQILLEVADTGEGIPAEHMGKIFNPFFSTRNKGSGLGLAMIKKIMDEVGGGIEIASTVDKGTKVSLYLPPLLAAGERFAADGREPDRR